MDRDELRLTGLLLVAILIGLGVKQLNRGPQIEPVVIEAPQRLEPFAGTTQGNPSGTPSALSEASFRMAGAVQPAPKRLLDINQAAALELESVSGIGPSLAQEIVNYRGAHGPFRTMDDLLQVSGIGPSRLQGLEAAFSVTGGTTPHESPRTPQPIPSPLPQLFLPAERIELNRALPGQLETLPGIGPVLAQRIIDHRQQKGPFTRTEQVMEVAGIGPKRYEKIAERIYVDPHAGPLPGEAAPGSSREPRPFRSTSSGGPAKVSKETQEKIDLNNASREQLESLPGIGPVLAERMLQYRQLHGGFQSPEEVKNISGIGEKKYEQIHPLVEISR